MPSRPEALGRLESRRRPPSRVLRCLKCRHDNGWPERGPNKGRILLKTKVVEHFARMAARLARVFMVGCVLGLSLSAVESQARDVGAAGGGGGGEFRISC